VYLLISRIKKIEKIKAILSRSRDINPVENMDSERNGEHVLI